LNLKLAATSRISDCIAGKSQREMDQSHTKTLPERRAIDQNPNMHGTSSHDNASSIIWKEE
jgi:hypothetical protein